MVAIPPLDPETIGKRNENITVQKLIGEWIFPQSARAQNCARAPTSPSKRTFKIGIGPDGSIPAGQIRSATRSWDRNCGVALSCKSPRMVDCPPIEVSGKIRPLQMRKAALKPVRKRKFVHTTDSKHDLPVAANVLNRQFNPSAPNLAYVSDITYIRTGAGWLYLATVLDLYARKVVGWAMAPSMPAKLVCDALNMAIQQRRPGPGLIVHSDRGSQYASELYQDLLTRHGFVCSMSRKGNCWDTQSNMVENACQI
jgi:hypothetical protein